VNNSSHPQRLLCAQGHYAAKPGSTTGRLYFALATRWCLTLLQNLKCHCLYALGRQVLPAFRPKLRRMTGKQTKLYSIAGLGATVANQPLLSEPEFVEFLKSTE